MSDNKFQIKASDANFKKRQNDIFNQLNIVENNLKNNQVDNSSRMETDEKPYHKSTPRGITKHFRGKESIFKVPQDPIKKNFIRNLPDFKKNPHKWTKYTLDDVKDEDLSERSNTKAAFAFLRELKNRKSSETETTDKDLPAKVVFKRPPIVNRNSHIINDKDETKPSFKSSKVVMPEYVVGQKIKKEKNNKNIKNSISKAQLKLDHLYEEND